MLSLLHRGIVRAIPQTMLQHLSIHTLAAVRGCTFRIPIIGGLEAPGITSTWKTGVIERLGQLRDGVFVDVGVNLGQTLIDFRATHPGVRYVGFEPNPTCVHYVRRLIEINGLRDCAIIPSGLGDAPQILPLYLHSGNSSDEAATLVSDLRPGRALEASFVPVFRLDAIWHHISQAPIAFAKIDVEGAELQVIQGMEETLQQHRPVILCEVLYTAEDASLERTAQRNASLMNVLGRSGYRVYQLVKPGDAEQIKGAELIETFPSAHWSNSNKDQCDYLFLPSESADEAISRLLA